MMQRRPAAERVQAQRDRILCAAQQCFVEHGFHAATMASIAAAAGMSAGLIYRYFDSKNAIILAIIARQLAGNRANIAALHADPDLGRRIAELFAAWQRRDPAVTNPVLFLEMSAEAARDPVIAAALAEADRITMGEFREWLRSAARRAGQAPAEAELDARALALRCLVEGLAVRAVREPTLPATALDETLALLMPLLTFGGR